VYISEPFGSVESIPSIQADNHVRSPQLLFRCGCSGEGFGIKLRMMYLMSLNQYFAKDSFRPPHWVLSIFNSTTGPRCSTGVLSASPLLILIW